MRIIRHTPQQLSGRVAYEIAGAGERSAACPSLQKDGTAPCEYTEPAGSPVRCGSPRPGLGGRYYLRLDRQALGVPGVALDLFARHPVAGAIAVARRLTNEEGIDDGL